MRTNLIRCIRSIPNIVKLQKFKITYDQRVRSYENEYINNFLLSHSTFTPRELGEVSRILAKHKPTDAPTWEAFENCAKRHANSLDEFDLRKVMSALITNECGSKELCSSLAKRLKELGLKSSGVTEEDYQEVRTKLSKIRPKDIFPLPIRVYLFGYKIRWQLIKFLERYGLIFK